MGKPDADTEDEQILALEDQVLKHIQEAKNMQRSSETSRLPDRAKPSVARPPTWTPSKQAYPYESTPAKLVAPSPQAESVDARAHPYVPLIKGFTPKGEDLEHRGYKRRELARNQVAPRRDS